MAAFVEDLTYLYGLIQGPYHVQRVWVEVTTDGEIKSVESD